MIAKFATVTLICYQTVKPKVKDLWIAMIIFAWTEIAFTESYDYNPPWNFRQLYKTLNM